MVRIRFRPKHRFTRSVRVSPRRLLLAACISRPCLLGNSRERENTGSVAFIAINNPDSESSTTFTSGYHRGSHCQAHCPLQEHGHRDRGNVFHSLFPLIICQGSQNDQRPATVLVISSLAAVDHGTKTAVDRSVAFVPQNGILFFFFFSFVAAWGWASISQLGNMGLCPTTRCMCSVGHGDRFWSLTTPRNAPIPLDLTNCPRRVGHDGVSYLPSPSKTPCSSTRSSAKSRTNSSQLRLPHMCNRVLMSQNG